MCAYVFPLHAGRIVGRGEGWFSLTEPSLVCYWTPAPSPHCIWSITVCPVEERSSIDWFYQTLELERILIIRKLSPKSQGGSPKVKVQPTCCVILCPALPHQASAEGEVTWQVGHGRLYVQGTGAMRSGQPRANL